MDAGQIVFVIGVGRSGTTAMANLLNVHPAVCIGIERYKFKFVRRGEFDGDEFTEARFFDFRETDTNILPSAVPKWQAVYEGLRRKFPQSAIRGDKIPHLFNRFDACARAFPEAKWIYMLRDINGVASSWNARARNPADKWPRRNDYRRAVQIWNEANALIRSRPAARLQVVSYEAFFGGAPEARRAVTEFVGIEDSAWFAAKTAGFYRTYAEVVRLKPPVTLAGQEEHLAATADMESYRALLARSQRSAAATA